MGDHLECRRRAAQTDPVKNQGDAVGHKQVTIGFISHDLGLGSPSNVVAESAKALNRSRSHARTKNSDFYDKPAERGVKGARVSVIKFFNYLIGFLDRFSYIHYFIKTNYITLVHSHWPRTDSGAGLIPVLAGGQKRLFAKPDTGPLATRLWRSVALDGLSPRHHQINGAAFNAGTAGARGKQCIGAGRSRVMLRGISQTLYAPERYIDPGLKHYSPDRFAVDSLLCTIYRKGQPVSARCADGKNMQEEARSSS